LLPQYAAENSGLHSFANNFTQSAPPRANLSQAQSLGPYQQHFRKTIACILMVIFFLDFAKVVAEMDVLVKEAEAVFNANFVASLDMILLHVNSPRACA
jgi:hypothetical protein